MTGEFRGNGALLQKPSPLPLIICQPGLTGRGTPSHRADRWATCAIGFGRVEPEHLTGAEKVGVVLRCDLWTQPKPPFEFDMTLRPTVNVQDNASLPCPSFTSLIFSVSKKKAHCSRNRPCEVTKRSNADLSKLLLLIRS